MRSLFVLMLILLATPALAIPSITNLQVRYPEVWLGESNNVYLTCTDSVTIDKVYANITGPDVILPIIYFSNVSGSYNLTIDSSYLDRVGQFNVSIVCNNTNGEYASANTQMDVSELTGYIYKTTESVYTGEVIEIDFVVMKNNQNLTSDVTFDVTFNNQAVTLKAPPAYDTNKGWLLKLDANAAGDYSAGVSAHYDRTSITEYTFITVKDEIEFEIINLDKTSIKPGDNITVVIKSSERDVPVNLNDNNLHIEIGNVNADILNITKDNDVYIVKISAPSLSYGRYDLYARLDYKGTHDTTVEIEYPMEIKGTLVPESHLKFISDDTEKMISTDINGDYSGYILPGTYTLELIFPRSRLYLYTVTIDNFTDAVRYSSPIDIEIPGVRVVGVHAYSVGLPFHDAVIEMSYDDSSIAYEDEIRLLKCYEWDFNNNNCNDDWVTTEALINKSTNMIRLTVYNFSAFAITTVKRMVLDFSFDKEEYSLGDIVTVSGRVYDEDMNTVNDVKVKLEVQDTEISSTTFSDTHGKFSIDFIAPDMESTYTVLLSAEKYGFKGSDSTDYMKVARSKDISVIFPDTVKIISGETLEKDLKVINIGQTDLYNLNIDITGIDYYFVNPIIEELLIGEEEVIKVKFFVPSNISKGTLSAKLIVSNDEVSKEELFGFTIEDVVITTTTIAPTGWAINLDLTQITSYLNSILFIIIFATIAFTIAYFMKKKRRKNHPEVDQLVSNIKNGNHTHTNTLSKLKNEINKMEKGLSRPKEVSGPAEAPVQKPAESKQEQKDEVSEKEKKKRDDVVFSS